MAKIFETKQDMIREWDAISLFANEYRYSFRKLTKFDVDFIVWDSEGELIGHAEVKGRNRSVDDQTAFPLAKRKYDKLCKKSGAKIIIWASEGGITYGQLDRLKGQYVRNGGRLPREGSANDIEEMYYYNRSENVGLLHTILYSDKNN